MLCAPHELDPANNFQLRLDHGVRGVRQSISLVRAASPDAREGDQSLEAQLNAGEKADRNRLKMIFAVDF